MCHNEDLKFILLGLDNVSDLQYSRLVSVFGKNNVDSVIKKLVNEDDALVFKLGRFIMSREKESIYPYNSSYDYYLNDISNISLKSLNNKKELINKIVYIISELNKLFDKVGNITNLNNEKSKPWISDKVEYCLFNCNDIELLEKIKTLYMSFVEKRNELVELNLKFVILYSKFYHKRERGVEFEDLIQYGNLGLIRAVETYDPKFDTEFITYAGYWIKQSIITNSKKIMYQFKIPLHIYNENNARLKVCDKLTCELGREPTDLEVANDMGITDEKVRIIKNAFLPTISLDASAGVLEESDVTNLELIPDMDVDLEHDMFMKQMAIELEQVMDKCLDNREIFILRNTYGLDAEDTEAKLSEKLGVSSQRVHQIKKRAIKKLCSSEDFRQLRLYLR